MSNTHVNQTVRTLLDTVCQPVGATTGATTGYPHITPPPLAVEAANARMFAEVERLLESHGKMTIRYDRGGGGVGRFFVTHLEGDWAYHWGFSLQKSIETLVSETLRMEKEKLQKRINEIDASSNL